MLVWGPPQVRAGIRRLTKEVAGSCQDWSGWTAGGWAEEGRLGFLKLRTPWGMGEKG